MGTDGELLDMFAENVSLVATCFTVISRHNFILYSRVIFHDYCRLWDDTRLIHHYYIIIMTSNVQQPSTSPRFPDRQHPSANVYSLCYSFRASV